MGRRNETQFPILYLKLKTTQRIISKVTQLSSAGPRSRMVSWLSNTPVYGSNWGSSWKLSEAHSAGHRALDSAPASTPRPASDPFPTLSSRVGMQGLARPLLARAGTSIPRKSPQGFVPQFAFDIASLPWTLHGSPSLADKGSRLTGQSGPGGVAQATAPKEE